MGSFSFGALTDKKWWSCVKGVEGNLAQSEAGNGRAPEELKLAFAYGSDALREGVPLEEEVEAGVPEADFLLRHKGGVNCEGTGGSFGNK